MTHVAPMPTTRAKPSAAGCPLCKSTDVAPRFQLSTYRIGRCRACGFDYNLDFAGGGGQADTFSESYYRDAHAAAFAHQLADFRHDASAPIYLNRLEFIERFVRPGRVLDVGCGPGVFLRLAKERGWQAQGVEISRFAAEHAQRTHDLPVTCGELADFVAPDESFDVVTFWDSIEHVARPREDFERALRLTRPGGLLLFTTDNFACLVADVAVALYRASRGALKYPVERVFIDRNLAYFTDASFRCLIEAAGLRVLLWEKMEYPLDKIKTNRAERLILRGFYLAAWLSRRQAQITVIVQKPEGAAPDES